MPPPPATKLRTILSSPWLSVCLSVCLVLSRTCLLNRSAFCNQNCNISEVFVIRWKSLRMTTPSLRPGLFRKPFPSYFCYFPSYFFISETLPFISFISETFPFVFLSFFQKPLRCICLFQKPFPSYFFVSETFPFVFLCLFKKTFPLYFFLFISETFHFVFLCQWTPSYGPPLS